MNEESNLILENQNSKKISEDTKMAIFEAIQNLDISTVNNILSEKSDEVILFEDDVQMTSIIN